MSKVGGLFMEEQERRFEALLESGLTEDEAINAMEAERPEKRYSAADAILVMLGVKGERTPRFP